MADKWTPAAAGRAVFCAVGVTETVPVFVLRLHSTGLWANVLLPDGRTKLVDHVDLGEHPADRRARQLLEAARKACKARLEAEAADPHSHARFIAERLMHEAIAEMADLVAEIDAADAEAGANRDG